MNYPYKENWWETRNHKKIKISDMETSHIENTIRYLQRHSDFYDELIGYNWFGYDYEDNSYLVVRKIEELQYELKKRRNNMKFKVGDKVRLNKNIKKFRYFQGSVGYDEIGTIIDIGYEKITINFPSCYAWNGLESELVLYNEKFFKKLPNDFTGTLEVENGYIVEKEILDDVEKEYLSAVIRPFKDKVKYIQKVMSSDKNREYISIKIAKDTSIVLPYFKKGTMYKGMEADKKYTLKELGL